MCRLIEVISIFEGCGNHEKGTIWSLQPNTTTIEESFMVTVSDFAQNCIKCAPMVLDFCCSHAGTFNSILIKIWDDDHQSTCWAIPEAKQYQFSTWFSNIVLSLVHRFDDDAAQHVSLCWCMWLLGPKAETQTRLHTVKAGPCHIVGCAVGVCAHALLLPHQYSHYQKFKTTHENNKISWYCIILHHPKFEIASYLLF